LGLLSFLRKSRGGSTEVQKGIRDVDGWGQWVDGTSTAGSTSVEAANAASKSLTPAQQYELSIAVNAAVNAICRNISKAQVRVFTRTGEEVVGGPLFDLLQRPGPKATPRKLIWEIVAWLNIEGEFGVRVGPLTANGYPSSLLPLNPNYLRVRQPVNPRTPGDVVLWQYVYCDGRAEDIRGDYLVFDRLFNPNHNTVRGLSPLVTGAVQVSGSYYAERYNKQFFENNAVPSHILNSVRAVPRQHREDFTSATSPSSATGRTTRTR
jgi:phage portal protein BeeE